tara:strand:+ start:1042 stop:1536 length:495 start_codon:yes stop_codon:yes gene_type:complete
MENRGNTARNLPKVWDPNRSIYGPFDDTQLGQTNASDPSLARRTEAINSRNAVAYVRICNEYGLTPEFQELYDEGLPVIQEEEKMRGIERRRSRAKELWGMLKNVSSTKQKRDWLNKVGVKTFSALGVGYDVPIEKATNVDIQGIFPDQVRQIRERAGIPSASC